MTRFFQVFPDYNVITEHTATGENFVVLTGRVQMTPNFSILKVSGSGKKAEVDFSAAVTLRDNLLLKETFLLDIVDLCQQSDLPLDVALTFFGKKLNSVTASA